MKKLIIILLLTLFALELLQAQERIAIIDQPYDHFTIDIQENIYLWKDAMVSKYSPTGELISQYSNPTLGTITHVDAKIPSKILVFFKESGTIVLLDHNLSPIANPSNLLCNNFFNITLAAVSNINQLALYDATAQQLYITDFNLNILYQSECNFSTEFTPTLLSQNLGKKILLTDTLAGLFLFDHFGTFEKRIALPHISFVDFWNNDIYYLKEGNIYKYNHITLEHNLFADRLYQIKEFKRYNHNIYYLSHSGKLYKYPIRS